MTELLSSKFVELFDLEYGSFRENVLSIHKPQYIGIFIPKSVEVEVFDHEAIIRTKSAAITLGIDGTVHAIIF